MTNVTTVIAQIVTIASEDEAADDVARAWLPAP